MPDLLADIIRVKRSRVEMAKSELPEAVVREQATRCRTGAAPHALLSALNNPDGVNIIAEFKRRSPSKGEIRGAVDPAAMARCYQAGGASAISVLTEQDYFSGSLDDLKRVREAVSLPILRKDFVFDQYQIYESAAEGADAVLLIVSALQDDLLRQLREIVEDELQMDALVEVHNEVEMSRAVRVGAKLIGVNNRHLRTFEVSLQTSAELADFAPPDVTLVSESGLNSSLDLKCLKALGYKGFLMGESLMRSEAPETFLRLLLESAI